MCGGTVTVEDALSSVNKGGGKVQWKLSLDLFSLITFGNLFRLQRMAKWSIVSGYSSVTLVKMD